MSRPDWSLNAGGSKDSICSDLAGPIFAIADHAPEDDHDEVDEAVIVTQVRTPVETRLVEFVHASGEKVSEDMQS